MGGHRECNLPTTSLSRLHTRSAATAQFYHRPERHDTFLNDTFTYYMEQQKISNELLYIFENNLHQSWNNFFSCSF